ncbi:hypothetical protein, partial [Klebsiella pneumoniae]|uniref:hypothetical protein n=1 Tax=Klebsiella pneumoniae TaxID=573 RepID=UPI00280C3CB3
GAATRPLLFCCGTRHTRHDFGTGVQSCARPICRQRLFVSVKRFDLLKSGLMRVIRSGEGISQRINIVVKRIKML